MPGRNYSRQFKLACVHQDATRLQPTRNVPLSPVASTVLPGSVQLRWREYRFLMLASS